MHPSLPPLPGAPSHLLAAAAGSGGLMEMLISLAPILLIFAIFYFILLVPARRERQAREKMIQELKKGDKVITNGGLYGEVTKVESPQLLVLKLADNVQVRIQRQAIASLQPTPNKGS